MPVHYTGTDTLELLTEARNYNADLVRRVLAVTRNAKRCLDFGAGLGTFAVPLAKTGRTVTCVEPDPVLRKKLREQGLTVYDTLAELPQKNIDCLYTLNVLEHIKNDTDMLRDFSSVLAPQGRVYIYVPAFLSLYSSLDKKVGHFRRYRKHLLAEPLRNYGFVVERARYVDTLGFFSSLLYRLLRIPQGRINRGALHIFDRYLFPLNRLLDPLCGRWFGKNLEVIARRA